MFLWIYCTSQGIWHPRRKTVHVKLETSNRNSRWAVFQARSTAAGYLNLLTVCCYEDSGLPCGYDLLFPNVSCSVMSDSFQPHGLWPTRFLCPWDFPGKNIGVGSHSLLQGIFPIQGLNLGLKHCRQILYCLSHQKNLCLQRETYFSSGSLWLNMHFHLICK